VDVEAVLAVRLRRKHLVKTVGGNINNALGGGENFYPLAESRTHPHHIRRHIEHDPSLLAVSGAAVDLSPLLAVPTAEQEGHSRRQL
jgi:hypothetical protein